MAYDPQHPRALGAIFVKMGYAVADGLDMTDIAVLMELGTAFMSAADELKEDTDAAIFDAVAGAAGDMAVRRRTAPTTTPE